MPETVLVRKCCAVCLWYDTHSFLCAMDRPECKSKESVCTYFTVPKHLEAT